MFAMESSNRNISSTNVLNRKLLKRLTIIGIYLTSMHVIVVMAISKLKMEK